MVSRERVGEEAGTDGQSVAAAMPNHAVLEFRKAVVPEEVASLCEFDRKVFGDFPDDLFPAEYWAELESYWVLSDGIKVGCVALQPNVDYDEQPRQGTLFIASTGLLAEFRGHGYGNHMKDWQIQYAREHQFKCIVTNAREGNVQSIRLNAKFGFRARERISGYYSNPNEAAIVMELEVGQEDSVPTELL